MKQKHQGNTKYGMVIDLDRCTGCGACVVSCTAENNIGVQEDETDKLRSITWMKLYKINNGKSFPDTRIAYLPRPCMHCDHHTPCVSVCPPIATETGEETGIVSQIYTRCIGCRYCMAACPYHARYFNWWDPVWPDGLERSLNPEVSPRMRGVVEKCTFCNHRLMSAKQKARMEGRKEVHEDEYQPACAEVCPADAIVFGNLKNPKSPVAKLAKDSRAFRLLDRLGTEPKVYYLTEKDWIRKQGDNHVKHG